MDRRGFLFGLGAVLVTAPAIVQASSLMPVKLVPITRTRHFKAHLDPVMKTVRWTDVDGEFVQWNSISNTWVRDELDCPIQPDYFDAVKEHFDIEEVKETPLPLPKIESWFDSSKIQQNFSHRNFKAADQNLRNLAFADLGR